MICIVLTLVTILHLNIKTKAENYSIYNKVEGKNFNSIQINIEDGISTYIGKYLFSNPRESLKGDFILEDSRYATTDFNIIDNFNSLDQYANIVAKSLSNKGRVELESGVYKLSVMKHNWDTITFNNERIDYSSSKLIDSIKDLSRNIGGLGNQDRLKTIPFSLFWEKLNYDLIEQPYSLSDLGDNKLEIGDINTNSVEVIKQQLSIHPIFLLRDFLYLSSVFARADKELILDNLSVGYINQGNGYSRELLANVEVDNTDKLVIGYDANGNIVYESIKKKSANKEKLEKVVKEKEVPFYKLAKETERVQYANLLTLYKKYIYDLCNYYRIPLDDSKSVYGKQSISPVTVITDSTVGCKATEDFVFDSLIKFFDDKTLTEYVSNYSEGNIVDGILEYIEVVNYSLDIESSNFSNIAVRSESEQKILSEEGKNKDSKSWLYTLIVLCLNTTTDSSILRYIDENTMFFRLKENVSSREIIPTDTNGKGYEEYSKLTTEEEKKEFQIKQLKEIYNIDTADFFEVSVNDKEPLRLLMIERILQEVKTSGIEYPKVWQHIGIVNKMCSAVGLHMDKHMKDDYISLPITLANVQIKATDKERVNTIIRSYQNRDANKMSSINADQLIYTASDRIKLHFYAMQENLDTNVSDIDKLLNDSKLNITISSTNKISTEETYTILPIDFTEDSDITVVNLFHYTLFNNVLNQMNYYKTALYNKLSMISNNESIDEQTTIYINILSSIREAIIFLEANAPNATDLKKACNTIWRDKDKNLEDLYKKLINMGIAIKDINNFKPADLNTHPLGNFINTDMMSISTELKKGIAISATFVPLKTNIYDPYAYSLIKDEAFFEKLHYLYGYHRKALMVDTNTSSATELYNTGKRGITRVATLKDLLEPERDITLYVDTGMYNLDKIAEMQDKALNRLDNSAEGENTSNVWMQLWDNIADVFTITIDEICKTGTKTTYSKSLADISDYAKSKDKKLLTTAKENAVLDGNYIDMYLKEETYSYMLPFTIVSCIYRDKSLYSFLNNYGTKPIFISSPNVSAISGVSAEWYSTYYNYLLLKNISANKLISYSTNIDMNCPIYVDIYGNILTESGYVVVPAATNATLHKKYTPLTAGFISTYGKLYTAEVPNIAMEDLGLLMMKYENKYLFGNHIIGNQVNLSEMSTSNSASLETLYLNYYNYLESGQYLDIEKYISQVFFETLRGAPLENIDKIKEGIDPKVKASRLGIVSASKLDNLAESFGIYEENSIVTLPDLTEHFNLNYIVLFLYKVFMLVVIILLIVQIYIIAIQMKFGAGSLWKLIGTIGLVLSLVWAIPNVFKFSYYTVNKFLLQSESADILMYSTEKESAGLEIGITNIYVPPKGTELKWRIQDINIPWYKLFNEILFRPVSSGINDIYEEYTKSTLAVGEGDFELRKDVLYIDINDVLKSSIINFDVNFGTIYQTTLEDKVQVSFYSPYYVFVDAILKNINLYNQENNIYSYSTTFQKGGKLKSIGLIESYFKSDEFAGDTKDLLKVQEIYGLNETINGVSYFTEEDIDKMRNSYWYNDNLTAEDILKRSEKLYNYTKELIYDNRDIIGKITDETFIKITVMQIAMQYNKLFSIDSCNEFEIFQLSQQDLIRLSSNQKALVFENSPTSFGRYVYETGGEIAVYIAAILIVVIFLASIVKPVSITIIFISMFVSIFIYKLILNKNSENTLGCFKTTVLVCISNFIYALLIKISMYLPNIMSSVSVCLFMQICLHTIFIFFMIWLVMIVVSDWYNLGNIKYNITLNSVKTELTGNNFIRHDNNERKDTGWSFYNKLKKKDLARKSKEEDENDI